MSAQANGRWSGWFGRGRVTHAHEVTTPASPTSTNSDSGSLVSGSYSVGGTMTRPAEVRTPSIRRSFSDVKNRPITGPRLRLYGYSRMCGAVRTSVSVWVISLAGCLAKTDAWFIIQQTFVCQAFDGTGEPLLMLPSLFGTHAHRQSRNPTMEERNARTRDH